MTTQDPDQIRDGIEQTQRELSADVDALTAKLSPQRMVHDRVQRARTAMSSMKERVTGSAAQKSSTADGTAASAADAAADVATGTASSAKGTVSSAASSAAKTAGTVTAAARRGIQASPVAAVLIAFGAGWLIAALLPSPGRSSGRRPR